MNYGEIISEAFRLTWRNRFLWFFGFFVGGSGAFFNIPNGVSNLRGPGGTSGASGAQIGRFISDNTGLIVALAVLLVVVLVLVGIFLWLISQGALVDSVAALHRGEERRFSSAFRAGLSNFWRVLGFVILISLISLVLALLTFLIAALPIVGVFAATHSSGARIATIILVVLLAIGVFIVVFIPLSIIWQLALRALVVNHGGVFSSLRSGSGLFRQRLGQSLLVWLIGIALALGAGFALLIVALIVGLILAIPAAALFFADLRIAGIVVGVVAAVVFLILFVIASAAIGTFNHAYWTLAYLRLATPIDRGPPQPAPD